MEPVGWTHLFCLYSVSPHHMKAQTFYNLAVIEMALSFIPFHSQSPPVKTPFENQILLALFIHVCHSECLSIIPRSYQVLYLIIPKFGLVHMTCK